MASRGGIIGAGFARIDNMAEVMTNLNIALDLIESKTVEGMEQAFEYVRYDMDVTSPLIPEDTRDMAKSWYVFSTRTRGGAAVEAGFTAEYAPYVHEMETFRSQIYWTRPGSGGKFFEKSIKRNTKKMFLIIAQNARQVTMAPNIPAAMAVVGAGKVSTGVYQAGETVEL